MSNKKVNLLAATLVVFVAVVIIALTIGIYSTPTEVVSSTAGNYTANLNNGGYVLEDEGFLFYSYPNQKGIYRVETEKKQGSVKIAQKGDGFLQVLGSGYYYTDNNTLYRITLEGKKEQVVREYASRPLIVGSLVFYLDEQGNLKKHSMQNKTESIVINAKQKGKIKEFVVYYKKIYYIDESGCIRKISFDGKKDELFITAKAKKLSLDGQYLFYIENGKLISAMLKDKEIIKAEITQVDEYAIFGSYIVYTQNDKTYHADVNKILSYEKYKPKVVEKEKVKGISIDENNFYYFANNQLTQLSHDGKIKSVIK